MSATVIGVDPHKRSHTAVVLDDCEQVASEIRVTASGGQVDELLAWAPAGVRCGLTGERRGDSPHIRSVDRGCIHP